MRCLTLADELHRRGARCRFICRELPGHLIGEVIARGHPVDTLPAPREPVDRDDRECSPGAHEDREIEQTVRILSASGSTWVVVDHYSLGERWERAARSAVRRIAVIDDLASRMHDCDLLLDQNLGRRADQYAHLVRPGCRILAGPTFALLRPEFAEWRAYSLRRRQAAHPQRLLVSLGGADQSDLLARVLAALQGCSLPSDCLINVVLGQKVPGVERVRAQAQCLPWQTDVLIKPPAIAQIMANSDLAIGAAGGAAWERCCLGLPTLIIVVADNQRPGAEALVNAGAALDLGDRQGLTASLPRAVESLTRRERLFEMSLEAGRLVDGLGTARVCVQLETLL
jgi:UDP-2,4-diacetamido-2,4,6-trideoxy-beta-L-altropyranose hydrolase